MMSQLLIPFLFCFSFYASLYASESSSESKEKCIKGDGKACNDYGNYLYKKKDVMGASTYYSKSCKLKLAAGCYNEANLEEYDLGNPDFALHRYQDACLFGDKDGCREFERLKKKGFKPAPVVDENINVAKTLPRCRDEICKTEIEWACQQAVKRVEKKINEKHSEFKMKTVCDLLISPKQPTTQHADLQQNFDKSFSYAYRRYCETAVYGRVVSFIETNKTDPEKIKLWEKEICNDTLFPPDKDELKLRSQSN